MIIELANIGPRPKAIDLVVSTNDIDLDVDGTELKADVKFAGKTIREDGKAHVRGTITTDLTIDCTRCLEPVAETIDISFDDIFVDPADAPNDTEIAVAAEELDEAIAEDGKVDLINVIREQILLALPEQRFCREDCKGLCPKCGGNRNLIDCKCEENEIDPRWAALKNFR